jgi:hypothetical protein
MRSMDRDRVIKNARMLVYRLERLSADSWWAHRASGLRGSLLRSLDRLEDIACPAPPEQEWQHLDRLMQRGYEILEGAAREIREFEGNTGKNP